MFNLSSVQNAEELPVITQINFKKRPISEHQSRRSGNLRKYDKDDSLFNDSTRSVYGVQSQENQSKSYRTLFPKERKNQMKLRIFESDKDPYYMRQKLSRKQGYRLMYTIT